MQERLSATGRGGRVRGVVNFGGSHETQQQGAMMPSNVSVTEMSIASVPILKGKGEASGGLMQPSLSGHGSPLVDVTVPGAGIRTPTGGVPLFATYARSAEATAREQEEEEQRQLSGRQRGNVAGGDGQYSLGDSIVYPSMRDMGGGPEKPRQETGPAVLGVALTRTQSKLTNRYDSASKNVSRTSSVVEGHRGQSLTTNSTPPSTGGEADSLQGSKKKDGLLSAPPHQRRFCGRLSLKAQLLLVLSLAVFCYLGMGLLTIMEFDEPCFCHGFIIPEKLRLMAQWIHVTCLKEYMRGILYVVAVFGEAIPSSVFHARSISSMDYLNQLFRMHGSTGRLDYAGLNRGAAQREIMSADDFMQTSVQNLIQEIKQLYTQSSTMTPEMYAQILNLVNNFNNNQLPSVKKARQSWVKQHEMAHKDLYSAHESFDVLAMAKMEAMAMVPSMLQQAMISCYRLEKCWNSDALKILITVMEGASAVINNATMVYLETIESYVNPGGGLTSLAELIIKVIDDIAGREAQLLNIPSTIDAISKLLTPQSKSVADEGVAPDAADVEPSGVNSDDLQYLLNALNDDWVKNFIAACQKAFQVAMQVAQQYSDNVPYKQWIRQYGADVVDRMVNATTPMALSGIFSSYFAYDIPMASMNPSRPDDEAAIIMKNYKNNNLLNFFDQLETQLQPHYDSAVAELATSVEKCVSTSTGKGVWVRSAFAISLFCAFILYIVAICLIRYRVDEAPVRFSVIAGVIGCMFALHVIGGLVLSIMARSVSVHSWALESRIINSVLDETELVRRAAKTMAKTMRLLLLVNKDYDSFMDGYLDSVANLTRISQTTEDNTWLDTAQTFVNVFQTLLKLGPNVLYHQMIAVIAEPATRALLDSLFPAPPAGLTSTTSSTCRAAMKTSSLVGLTNSYVNSLITSAVISGQTLARMPSDCSQVGLGVMDAFCTVAAMVHGSHVTADVDDDDDCYEPAVCQQPLQYGMLCSMCDGTGMNSLINPMGKNFVGSALYYWNISVTDSIPNRETQIITSLINLMKADASYMVSRANFAIALTVIICIIMQLLIFLIWHLLTGTSVLYSML